MVRSNNVAIISLEEAKARFEEWRNNRRGKARIPAELWSAAVEVARREGINRTARELHVAWDDLKRRMPATGAVPQQPVFLELVTPEVQSVPECTLEVEGRRGKLVRNTDDRRTGTFTSGIVSIWREWRIALYFTGWKHAGENLADVLERRAAERDAPIQMCDALSRNTPRLAGVEVLLANCLAHGRRQVVDVAANFPEECRYVLETMGKVYLIDAQAREKRLSPGGRLLLHQEHSVPLMDELHEWMETQFAEHKTEPNSGLGKAIS